MARKYDLVVVGTGTAAMVAATRVRASGWTVAVIDERPFGGTCALRGCDPTFTDPIPQKREQYFARDGASDIGYMLS